MSEIRTVDVKCDCGRSLSAMVQLPGNGEWSETRVRCKCKKTRRVRARLTDGGMEVHDEEIG